MSEHGSHITKLGLAFTILLLASCSFDGATKDIPAGNLILEPIKNNELILFYKFEGREAGGYCNPIFGTLQDFADGSTASHVFVRDNNTPVRETGKTIFIPGNASRTLEERLTLVDPADSDTIFFGGPIPIGPNGDVFSSPQLLGDDLLPIYEAARTKMKEGKYLITSLVSFQTCRLLDPDRNIDGPTTLPSTELLIDANRKTLEMTFTATFVPAVDAAKP